MDLFTRRFVRNALIAGFVAGLLGAILFGAGREWQYGLFMGALFAVLLGLTVAFFSGRESIKPVFPLDHPPPLAAPAFQPHTHTVFPYQAGSGIWLIVWAGAVVVFLLLAIVPPVSPTYLLLAGVLGFLGATQFLIRLVAVATVRLIVAPDRLEYRSLTVRLRTSWDDLERFERRGSRWALVCKQTELDANAVTRAWLLFFGDDKIILVDSFAHSFLESDVLSAILARAPQVKLYTTL